MTFQVTTALKKINLSKKRITVCKAGTSVGKTYCIMALLINYAATYKRQTILCIAETIPSIKMGSLQIFKDIMVDTNRWIEEHFNATELTYTFSNGSKIMFKSFDSVGKAKAAGKRNVLFINEGNHINWPIVNELMIRTTEKIYIDYNPSEESWIDTEIIGSEDVDVVSLMWKDNEAISPNIVKELEKRLELSKTSEYWKNWCDVYIYGKLGQLEGTIFNNWKIVDKIPEECKLIGYGCDFGYSNDPSTLIGIYQLNENDIYIDELIYQTQLTNTDLGKKIKSLNLPNLTIFADSSNPGGIEEIRRMGINIQPAKKGPDSIKLGIDILQRFNLHITNSSINTIKEFRNYKWETNKGGIITNTPASGYDHSIDAIRYLSMMKLKQNKSGVYNTITI